MPGISLTPEEVNGLMLEAGLAATPGDAQAIWDGVVALADDDALLDALGASLAGGGSPEAIEAARRLGERETRRIWGDWLKTELNKIGQAVADGVERGLGPREIARTLDAVKGLDPARARRYEKMKAFLEFSDRPDAEVGRMLDSFFRKELRSRKRTIAQFEARQATSQANRIIADDRGQNWKAWITKGDSRVGEDHVANESAGWIPKDDAFPSGDQHPPGRPKCRCTVTYRTATPGEAAKQRAETRAERTREATEVVTT